MKKAIWLVIMSLVLLSFAGWLLSQPNTWLALLAGAIIVLNFFIVYKTLKPKNKTS